jgi:hypothetical protein
MGRVAYQARLLSPARHDHTPGGAQETGLIRNAAHEQAEAIRLASCYEASALRTGTRGRYMDPRRWEPEPVHERALRDRDRCSASRVQARGDIICKMATGVMLSCPWISVGAFSRFLPGSKERRRTGPRTP